MTKSSIVNSKLPCNSVTSEPSTNITSIDDEPGTAIDSSNATPVLFTRSSKDVFAALELTPSSPASEPRPPPTKAYKPDCDSLVYINIPSSMSSISKPLAPGFKVPLSNHAGPEPTKADTPVAPITNFDAPLAGTSRVKAKSPRRSITLAMLSSMFSPRTCTNPARSVSLKSISTFWPLSVVDSLIARSNSFTRSVKILLSSTPAKPTKRTSPVINPASVSPSCNKKPRPFNISKPIGVAPVLSPTNKRTSVAATMFTVSPAWLLNSCTLKLASSSTPGSETDTLATNRTKGPDSKSTLPKAPDSLIATSVLLICILTTAPAPNEPKPASAVKRSVPPTPSGTTTNAPRAALISIAEPPEPVPLKALTDISSIETITTSLPSSRVDCSKATVPRKVTP